MNVTHVAPETSRRHAVAQESSIGDRQLADQAAHHVYVARQPILDKRQRVVEYELLFRSNPQNVLLANQEDLASRSLIGLGLTTFGLVDLTQGRRAHITFSRSLLLNPSGPVLPPEMLVVEIVEAVPPDLEVLHACNSLKRAGYQIVLRDVVELSRGNPYQAVANVLRVDFRQTSALQRSDIARANMSHHYTLLAENVDTHEEFAEVAGLNFDLFQGCFFQRPDVISRESIPGSKLASLRLVKELNQADVDWQHLEQILKQDIGLSIKLLRYLNSAWFGVSQPVESLRHAMIMLGIDGLRQWVGLAVVTDLGQDKSPELMTVSLLRATMCERLAKALSLPRAASNLFLVGLFSSLDSLLGRPLEELLEELAVPDEVRDALLGRPGRPNDIYRLVLAYEQADWSKVSEQSLVVGLDEGILPLIYARSVEWVDQILKAA